MKVRTVVVRSTASILLWKWFRYLSQGAVLSVIHHVTVARDYLHKRLYNKVTELKTNEISPRLSVATLETNAVRQLLISHSFKPRRTAG
jgi:hypothetical protein